MTLAIDWRDAWIDHNRRRPVLADATLWDQRAPDFEQKVGISDYAERFIELLAPEPGASIMDIGCGGGSLAIPLAAAGHQVVAADFSPGMLAVLERQQKRAGLTTIRARLLDWNEDWQAAGIEAKSVDIAIASRSTMVDDLFEAFTKLNTVARRRVAITMATEYSPHHSPIKASEDGKGGAGDGANNETHGEESAQEPADYLFGVNLLLQMGLYPRLNYVDNYKGERLIRWAFLAWDVPA